MPEHSASDRKDAHDVSVVIPCFNREDTIGPAVESVLAQDIEVGEICVVDDGSTDASREVASAFGDPVRVISIKNSGGSGARNRGIDATHGDWIAFLDSDDTWEPSKLRLQFEALHQFPEARFVFCDQQVCSEAGTIIESRFALGGVRDQYQERENDYLLFDRSLFVTMLNQSRVFTSSVVAHRSLEALRFPDGYPACQDWPVWLRLSLETRFCAVDQPLVTMNSGADQISRRKARLMKYCVHALQDILRDASLTPQEHEAVEQTLADRLHGATYHALVEGKVCWAREFLAQLDPNTIGHKRYWYYKTLSLVPPSLLSYVATRRLSKQI